MRKKPKDFVPGVRSFEWPSVVQQMQKGSSRRKRSEGHVEVADTLDPCFLFLIRLEQSDVRKS
jgi:hypothetical protein